MRGEMEMNYNVTIEDGVMKAKIAERSFSLIWMHRKPRGRPVESKPGLYILVDDRECPIPPTPSVAGI